MKIILLIKNLNPYMSVIAPISYSNPTPTPFLKSVLFSSFPLCYCISLSYYQTSAYYFPSQLQFSILPNPYLARMIFIKCKCTFFICLLKSVPSCLGGVQIHESFLSDRQILLQRSLTVGQTYMGH